MSSRVFLTCFSKSPKEKVCRDKYLRNHNISCNDINMRSSVQSDSSNSLLIALAEFRFELRSFLHFSERAAEIAGMHPQQHQLLLQIAGVPEGKIVTIAYAAERLGLKHNSAVELVDRSEREGLVARRADAADKRRAILQITSKGKKVLGRLTASHARELNELGPRLAQVLKQISVHANSVSTSEIE
jgi:DNA-binding MarR family transcriptional regulator